MERLAQAKAEDFLVIQAEHNVYARILETFNQAEKPPVRQEPEVNDLDDIPTTVSL